MAADDIVAMYPELTMAQVHGALAFYFDNREEIERQIQEDADFIRDMKARQESRSASGPESKPRDDITPSS